MNQEFLFKYGKIEMVAILVDGVAMLPAKEVCQMLGIKNHRDAISRLKKNERALFKATTSGGSQKMTHITEIGLYRLIFSSRKPEAEKFQDWVFEEVLPKIRRTGVYNLVEENEQTEFGKAMIRTIYGMEESLLYKKDKK